MTEMSSSWSWWVAQMLASISSAGKLVRSQFRGAFRMLRLVVSRGET
jgi:hypothetical protein